MSLRAGFSAIDITPPLGTLKIGWIQRIEITAVADPLYARVAILESNGAGIAFVQLDVLSAPWRLVAAIRDGISQAFRFPPDAIMVCATHNHAGPAVASLGDVPRDSTYVATLVGKAIKAFGEALSALEPAEMGLGRTLEWRVGHNRRLVTRDGLVKTHGLSGTSDTLYPEGPIDPELAIAVVRSESGRPLGTLLNYALHPTYHGGDGYASANFPGLIAETLKENGYPHALFLQGCAGNVDTLNPFDHSAEKPMEETGRLLAEASLRTVGTVEFRRDWNLSFSVENLGLPYRDATPEEIDGTVPGAQRLVDPSAYDRMIPRLLEKMKTRSSHPAQVQVLAMDDHVFVSLPGEIFVELGLRIKEAVFPRVAHVVAYANGMVGYVPHAAAFKRGGYETTFAPSSKLAPVAGDMLVETALRLIRTTPH